MQLTTYSDRAFSIDDFLTAPECQALIDLSEVQGFAAADVRAPSGAKAMPMVRNNARVLLASPQWVSLLWLRLGAVQLPQIDTQEAAGLPQALRFYKYTAGQRFKMHKDGPWTEGGLTSQLTLLVYLNEGFTGGETRFKTFSIAPRTGSALLFMHDTWHEGAAVHSGSKYVVRSDVLYRPLS
jgi:predicted 2-oxoglutarate/Fe(II)-dependent dioxygenase YbiX